MRPHEEAGAAPYRRGDGEDLERVEKTVRRRIDDGLLRAIRLRRSDDRRGPVRVA